MILILDGRAMVEKLEIEEGHRMWHYAIKLKDGTYTKPKPAYSKQAAIVAAWEALNS